MIQKIAGFRRQLGNQICKAIRNQEFDRVHILFAVQAIEAWILADEHKVNEYLVHDFRITMTSLWELSFAIVAQEPG